MEQFEKRVRAAAAAAWWTVLIGFLFLILQWVLYLIFTSAQPSWLPGLWGPGTNWAFVQTVWFWGTAGIKAFLWVLVVVALWLTLWARELRKRIS